MKKLLLVLLMGVMICSFTACGGGNDGIDPDATVTVEQYDALMADDARWEMSCEELEQYLKVKSIVDEDSTKSWGEGYLVVDFPGPDEKSKIHVLFKEKDGKQTVSSYSPTGVFLGRN